MMNRVRTTARTEVRAAPQASPGLKTLARLLSLNSEELEQLIEQELEENPALEASDEERVRIVAPNQPAIISWDYDATGHDADEGDYEEWFETRIAAPALNLKSHVRGQLRLSVAPELLPIAEYLVESLDDRGYLQAEVEEVALQLNASLESVERVLALLQQCDPPGVGARSLQECLLLQIESLRSAPKPPYERELLEITHDVLAKGWLDFSSGRWEALQRRLKIAPETLEQVKLFIRSELRPYPAGDWEGRDSSQDLLSTQAPDIVIRASQQGLHIEICGLHYEWLRLSPAYLEHASCLQQSGRRINADEREHIQHYLSRARIFLQALQLRYQTLKRIMEAIAQRQYGFLMTSDARFLQPMTRVEVAEATRLHRSTIGRAVRNKWLQLPSGMMVPLDMFFDASYRTAMLIQQILHEHEGAGKRLSDAEIAEKLAEMGIEVARRTVAKYRQRHNILSSHWRERQRLVG
ncbi:MAG: RNA polymerase sigma-54 factor [Fimbriimonadales bacterium]|nr:MAG: RNA polymerase sigma-54 factor [Fimbriimonadales bacterium]